MVSCHSTRPASNLGLGRGRVRLGRRRQRLVVGVAAPIVGPRELAPRRARHYDLDNDKKWASLKLGLGGEDGASPRDPPRMPPTILTCRDPHHARQSPCWLNGLNSSCRTWFRDGGIISRRVFHPDAKTSTPIMFGALLHWDLNSSPFAVSLSCLEPPPPISSRFLNFIEWQMKYVNRCECGWRNK